MRNIFKSIKGTGIVPKLNLALVVFLIIFIAFRLFAPITPAVYDKPVIQNADQLYAGRTLTYTVHSCRNVGEGVVTTITRQLISTTNSQLQSINLSTDVITNPARCTTVTRTLIIPYSTPAGTYKLVIRGIYNVIPMRAPISVTTSSDPVTIHATTADQEIQDLINANNELQGQLQLQATASSNSRAATQNRNSSTTTNNITNNTTNNTNNPPSTSPSDGGDTGLVQGVLNAIGGGLGF